MNKFKVGDYVRIKKIRKEDMRNYGMYVGIVGKINNITNVDKLTGIKEKCYYVLFTNPFRGKSSLGTYKDELELVTELEYFMEVI